jgi:hypothetical protein
MPDGLAAIGGTMQKFIYQSNEDDRRVARKWRWVSVCFYSSLLAGMTLYAALHWNPGVNYASADSTRHAKVVSASNN